MDEADVWKKLEQLQQTYQHVYDEQAAYYQALLDERDQALSPPDWGANPVVMPMAEPRRIYRAKAANPPPTPEPPAPVGKPGSPKASPARGGARSAGGGVHCHLSRPVP